MHGTMDGFDLLREHVERFNAGVRSGHWVAMVELFTEDAELVFVGVPVGPLVGRAAIAEAYRTSPPDDEIRPLEPAEQGGTVVAGYAWLRQPDVRAGEMRLTPAGDRIRRLVVTLDPG
jgi:steroid delta-isomerase